jgi:flagellar biogenesis protein FliO
MELIRQVAAVAGVLALLAATLWWLRGRGPGLALARKLPRRKLECMERLPLGPQHTLHLIRLGDQALIVASSPSGCTLVRSLSWREIEEHHLETSL